jgi:YD repeat-containing protein
MRPVIVTCLYLSLPAVAAAQISSTDISATTQPTQVQELGTGAAIQVPALPAAEQQSSFAARSETHSTDAPAQSASSGGINFSKNITFSEFPLGTAISHNYKDRGIIFGGSQLEIVDDISSATSPVLGGTPPDGEILEGNITGQFVIPGTNTPAPVYRVAWTIGSFDAVGSVEMEFFGPQGQLLFSLINPQLGFSSYSARGGSVGIASWRFRIISTEPSGFGIDNVYFSTPGQDDADREKGEVDCARGNPVNPAVGNKYQLETDYKGSRPFPLTATRAYNSIGGSWQVFPKLNYTPGDVASQIIRPDGKGLTYLPYSGSNWRPTSTDITGSLDLIIDQSGLATGWRYTTDDDQVEVYDEVGRLSSVTQRSGISHNYAYSENKITVSHSFGGSLTYMFDETGKTSGFTDPAGKLYRYSYGANGLFSEVSYPDGSGRSYHYEDASHNDLLTGISDANGERFASWAYDSNRRAISSEHNNGAELVNFDYSQTNHPGTAQTTVTNALGKETTYHFITVNGARKVFHVSGHASANCVAANQSYSFDSNAFVASKTDWKGNVTAYVRNDRGQILSRTVAQGSPQERITVTQWHPVFNLPLKVIEPGKETDFSYDDQGNVLSQTMKDTGTP